MFNNPFREEAAASRNERQQLNRLLRVTAPRERVILAGIGLVLAGFVAWALFGSIVHRVAFDGVMIESGARHGVVSSESGFLVELLVVPGDRIAAGDPIARQTVPELDREMEFLRERVDLLEAEIREAGGEGAALHSLLDSAHVALLQMEARRAVRSLIIGEVGGVVANLYAAPGDYLASGSAVALLREVDDRSLRAVLRAAPDMVQRIQPGMQASVEVAMPDSTIRRLEGEVVLVASGPLPHWLAALLPGAAESGHRVDVVLPLASTLSVPDGAPCRIRIELGRSTPAALLVHGLS